MVMSPQKHNKRGINGTAKVTDSSARDGFRDAACRALSLPLEDRGLDGILIWILTSSSFEELLFYLYRPMIKRKDKSEERVALAFP